MKVTRSISLAASGDNGLGLTHPLDCNAWLIDSGEGLILVDAGVNLDNLRIEEEIAADGYRLSDIRYLVVTHAHADHAAGSPTFSGGRARGSWRTRTRRASSGTSPCSTARWRNT